MKDAIDALADHLDAIANDIVPEPPFETGSPDGYQEYVQRFRIENEEQLAWATRKYANAERLVAETKEAAEAQIKRIEEWADKRLSEQHRRMSYFNALCTDYLLRQQADDKKLKGIDTPYARVQSRKQPSKWSVVNEKAVVKAIKAYGHRVLIDELVKVEETLSLSAIKDAAESGTDIQLVETSRDPITDKPIYKLQLRTVNSDGEIEWVDLDVTAAEQPDKVSVEIK